MGLHGKLQYLSYIVIRPCLWFAAKCKTSELYRNDKGCANCPSQSNKLITTIAYNHYDVGLLDKLQYFSYIIIGSCLWFMAKCKTSEHYRDDKGSANCPSHSNKLITTIAYSHYYVRLLGKLQYFSYCWSVFYDVGTKLYFCVQRFKTGSKFVNI